ncbi:MAG TPA: DinB family protein [Clostridia bacterium]|nr:DinB family protein [Clostridia bacterium]
MSDSNRKYWNEQFKILQDTWPKPDNFSGCISICLELHGMVHSRTPEQAVPVSFEDELWTVLTEEAFRKLHHGDQSIAWKLWHSGRIEDMTMNVLIAGAGQVIDEDDRYRKLNVKARDTGNAMNEDEIAEMSGSIDIEALKSYRNEVAGRTRKIIRSLKPQDLKLKVDAARLDSLMADGSLVPGARGIYDYWKKKTYAGLLLMPATRHLLVHLNESMRLVPASPR